MKLRVQIDHILAQTQLKWSKIKVANIIYSPLT